MIIIVIYRRFEFCSASSSLHCAMKHDAFKVFLLADFHVNSLQDKETMLNLIKLVDKASGYIFGLKGQDNMASLMSCAAGADFDYFVYPLFTAGNVSWLSTSSNSSVLPKQQQVLRQTCIGKEYIMKQQSYLSSLSLDERCLKIKKNFVETFVFELFATAKSMQNASFEISHNFHLVRKLF